MSVWERFVFATVRAAVLAYFEVREAWRLLQKEGATDEDRARLRAGVDFVRMHLSKVGAPRLDDPTPDHGGGQGEGGGAEAG